MRINPILGLVLVSLLSAGGGVAAGYAAGSAAIPQEAAAYGQPMLYHLAATSPPALQTEDSPSVVETAPRYVLGTEGGFVAVFYASNPPSLKTQTRKPESALTPAERERLKTGIAIYTEEELTRALQDYGS